MNKLKKFLFGVIAIDFYDMNYPFSKELDKWFDAKLNESDVLDNIQFVDNYICTFYQRKFWIANYPYGFHLDGFIEFRPSRYNIYRFYELLNKV